MRKNQRTCKSRSNRASSGVYDVEVESDGERSANVDRVALFVRADFDVPAEVRKHGALSQLAGRSAQMM